MPGIFRVRNSVFSAIKGKFDDKGRPYKPITSGSLCACSALPYIEQTVEIEGDIYCEGALSIP